MNKALVLTIAAGVCCLGSSPTEPTVTKIVTRPVGQDVRGDSFAAKPKTLYRAGNKYARTEEELDAENNIHALIIVSEPDTWMINLADKTGRHIVDPGPTFNFHAPIVWMPKSQVAPETAPAFKELEFGNELQFFRRNGAQDIGTRQIDKDNCKTLVLERNGLKLTLLVEPGAQRPVQLDIEQSGRATESIRYVEYEVGLPFEHFLFEPPKGVKISEANAEATAGRYDELAAWAKQDSADYARLIADMNKARNAHEVAMAMKENRRRQQETNHMLFKFVHAHSELRDAARLGLERPDQLTWHRQHPNRMNLPSEVNAIAEEMSRSMSAVDKKGNRMVEQLRKYLGDPEVLKASKELEQMNEENSRRLLGAMQ
jgi:hypothetical protein